MRSRRWISILAVLGVLLHAGAIVRHNAAMAAASLQYQALVAGLSQICHSTGSGTLDASEVPYVPRPSDAQNGCPICSGLGQVVALSAPACSVIPLTQAEPAFLPANAQCLADSGHAVCPPARGPPALA